MHRLDRDPVAPAGLANYRHAQDQWTVNSPNHQERQAIWAKLGPMQGWRCAYCEADIARPSDEKPIPGHIEHFRQRSRHPQGTFDWRNLFGSCNRTGTCGDHKDKCGIYNPSVLIKPDLEDPENFLVFLPDGTVRPRAKLSDADLNRAKETIRILKLDGALNQIRRAAVSGYMQTAEELAEMAAVFPEDEWLPELERELAQTAHLPFATAIKHVLTNQAAQEQQP